MSLLLLLDGAASASLVVTEANDALASTATVLVGATLSATEAADSLVATVTVLVSSTLALTEAVDTITSTASVLVSATFAVTEAADALASTVTVLVGATLAVTEAADTLASTATVLVSSTLAVTEAVDTIASTATVLVSGTLAATEIADSLSSVTTILVAATLSITEAVDTIIATAVVTSADILATLAITEANDTLSATANSGVDPQPVVIPDNPFARTSSGGYNSDLVRNAPPILTPVIAVLVLPEDDDGVASSARISGKGTVLPLKPILKARDKAVSLKHFPLLHVPSVLLEANLVENDDIISSISSMALDSVAMLCEHNDTVKAEGKITGEGDEELLLILLAA